MTSSDDGLVLVTGATGNTGRGVVRALAERGVPVRAMVRREADRDGFPAGVQVTVGDFDDPGSLAAALDGAARAYLVTPSSERAGDQQRRFADLAVRAGAGHLVVLSQLGARADSPVRFLRYHAVVEEHIRGLGIGYTFLRPNLFFQGLLAFAPLVSAQSRFFAPIGDARVSAIDVRDIAGVAAAVLSEDGHEGATYTLTGPAAITHAEIAAALSAALGREIRFADAAPEDFGASLRGLMPDWQAEGLLEDYAHYRRGEAAEVTTAVSDISARRPMDIGQFARDYAEAFK